MLSRLRVRSAFGALALEFSVEIAFGLAAFSGDTLEGGFFVEAFQFEGFELGEEGLRGGFGGGGCRRLDQEGDFAADAVAVGEGGLDFGDRAAEELFVELGELAGEDDAQSGAPDGGQVGEGFLDAVRSFVEDEGGGRPGGFGEGFEGGAAGAGFFGKEAEEAEVGGVEAGGDEGGEGGVGAGDGIDGDLGGEGGLGEEDAWIGDARHAGVGDQGYGLAFFELGDEFDGAVALVVLVEADGWSGDAEVVEELLGLTGVFAGDARGGAQDAKGAEGDVFQVADGRGYEVEAGCEGKVFADRRERLVGGLVELGHWVRIARGYDPVVRLVGSSSPSAPQNDNF